MGESTPSDYGLGRSTPSDHGLEIDNIMSEATATGQILSYNAGLDSWEITMPNSSGLPSGTVTGDFIRYNTVTGAWEVAAEPLSFKQIVLTPAASAMLDIEGGMWYKSTDKSVYVCTVAT